MGRWCGRCTLLLIFMESRGVFAGAAGVGAVLLHRPLLCHERVAGGWEGLLIIGTGHTGILVGRYRVVLSCA